MAVIRQVDGSVRMALASPAAKSYLDFSRGDKNILQMSHKDTVGLCWNQNQLPKTTVFILKRTNNCALKKVSQSTTKTSLGSLQGIPCIWLSAVEQ